MSVARASLSLPSIAGLALALALSQAACTADSGGPGGPKPVTVPPPELPSAVPGITLQVSPSTDRAGEVLVAAVLNVPAEARARVMELQIKHSPDLEYVGFTKGGALETAEKDLVVQSKTADVVRAVAYSGASLTTIASGTLVTVRFAARGSGPYRVEVLTDKPVFAPPQANDGLHVSDPVEVRF